MLRHAKHFRLALNGKSPAGANRWGELASLQELEERHSGRTVPASNALPVTRGFKISSCGAASQILYISEMEDRHLGHCIRFASTKPQHRSRLEALLAERSTRQALRTSDGGKDA